MRQQLARARAVVESWVAGAPAPTVLELGLATAIVATAAAVVFGPHVAHGGFWYDDWSNAAAYRFSPSPRLWHATETFREVLGSRPVLAFGLAAPHAAFGLDTSLHIALAVGLGALASVLLYVLIRTLGASPPPALAVAVLALVFPWADSLRLWPSAGINQLALVLYLAGVLVALAALRRGSSWLHAVSVALYVLAVLTYESVAAVVLLSGALYLAKASRRPALRRWAVDLAVMAAGLGYALATTTKTKGTIAGRIDAVPEFAKQAVELLGIAVLPLGDSRAAKAAGGLLVAALAVVAIRRWRRRELAELGPWLGGAVLAFAVIGVTYAFFLGRSQVPLAGGGLNRGNLFAAPAYAFVVVVAAQVAASIVGARTRVPVGLVAAALVAAVAVSYGYQAREDAARWDRGADLQARVLVAVRAAVATQSTGVTVYTFGAPGSVSFSIPVFSTTYDLDGAARVTLGDRTLHAYPVWGSIRLTCGPRQIVPSGRRRFDASIAAPYGRAILVDVPSGRTARPESREACRRAVARFTPGPAFAPAA